MDGMPPRLRKLYESRRITVTEAFRNIRPGARIFIGSACAEPRYLVRHLTGLPGNIADCEILQLLSLNPEAPYTTGKFRQMFRLNTPFAGPASRAAVVRGDADYTPVSLSEIPRLIESGRLHIDVALVQVTPPDERGMCSLGVSVETVKAAIENADYVIAQVNPEMPRTLGDSFVRVKDLDAVVEHEEPIIEYISSGTTEEAGRIGEYAARLVPDGATVQIGIGRIPNAVLKHLTGKHDLGVHTEMFSDSLLDLWQSGAITNARKTLHPGKITASFCMGTRRLYDTVNNNPEFEFWPADHVSDPRIIARNDTMVSINSALEMDLTGQVCADSIGHEFYSGIGGQADFMRGAALSRNGRPVIVMPSTAKGGSVSRIVPYLSPGAGVVTARGDVHYVVTEWGIASLHGKTIRERVLELITIAHPKFRRWLLFEAKELCYLYPDQELPPEGGCPCPEYRRWTFTTPDGRGVLFRPVGPTDEERLRRLFYTLREGDIYSRFMAGVKTLPHAKAQQLVVLDCEEKFAIAACVGAEPDEEFAGVARWLLDRKTNMAEVAFTVDPSWQGCGIGGFLFARLVEAAREKGIAGFTAEVLATNQKMLNVFYRSGFEVRSETRDGVCFISILFGERE